MNCTVYIATSLDGFIARTDGGIDWLPAPASGGEDYGYSEFMNTVDALVMGRHTFELAMTFGTWPYRKPVYVLTSRPESLPSLLPDRVRALSGSPREVVETVRRDGCQHVYVDGGNTIQRFLRAGLVNRMIITTIPVLIGTGIPLFGPLERDIALTHVGTRAYDDGLVQSEYRIPSA
ncbi:MAG: dihydrofolate reductase family protein [Gemmatimonadaceae bacterium]